jgi:hypothetical protein
MATDGECELLRQSVIVTCGTDTADYEGECKPISTSNTVQIAVGAVIATFLSILVAILVYLACRNPGRAQQIVFSVVSTEAVLGIEIGADLWDVATDGIVFFQFQQQRERAWVDNLTIPFTTFFATSCAISAASFAIKLRLIWLGLRSRVSEAAPILSFLEADSSGGKRRPSAAHKLARTVSAETSQLASVLHKDMFANTIQTWTYYCYFGVVVFEDIPMGAISAYFILRSVHECLTEAKAVGLKTFDLRCDLKPDQTMLSLAGVITSFASLAYKAARKPRDRSLRMSRFVREPGPGSTGGLAQCLSRMCPGRVLTVPASHSETCACAHAC